MEQIFSKLIANFDFGYMFVINVFTYIIIKIIDYFNGNKTVSVLIKRICLICAIIMITAIYLIIGYDNKLILVNSAIVAPIAWSWIFRPILNKYNLGYKKQ